MAHPRETLRKAVKTAINGVAGLTAYDTRFYPVSEDDLPCCHVYVTSEDAEDVAMDGRQRREANISALITVKVNDAPEDALDALCLAVEKAVSADTTLGGAALDIALTGTEFDTDGGADQKIMSATLNYSGLYVCRADDPEQQ